MFTVHKKERLDLGEGASVMVRGMTAAEFGEFAMEGSKNGNSAAVRASLCVVSGAKGFRRYTDDACTKSEAVPEAEVTGDWLMENTPLWVCVEISNKVIELSKAGEMEKKE